MENWYDDPKIMDEASQEWFDKPEIVAELQDVFDPEGSGYDMKAAKQSGMKPVIDPEDGLPHYGSVIEATKQQKSKYGLPDESYMLLKGKEHETWDKAIQAEADRGFRVKKFGDRYFSIPAEINTEGKDVTEEIKINRTNQIKNYFTEQGYSKEAVAGILGNIAVESAGTFDSTIKQRKGGKAIGIYQMEPPMRKAYEGWLEKNNIEDSGISQSKYIHALIEGTDNTHPKDGGPYLGKGKSDTIKKLLSNAKTPEEAAIAFQDYIEKPGVPHTDRRIKKANEYYVSD